MLMWSTVFFAATETSICDLKDGLGVLMWFTVFFKSVLEVIEYTDATCSLYLCSYGNSDVCFKRWTKTGFEKNVLDCDKPADCLEC